MFGAKFIGLTLLMLIYIILGIIVIFYSVKGYKYYRKGSKLGYFISWGLSAGFTFLIIWLYTWRESNLRKRREKDMCEWYSNNYYVLDTSSLFEQGYDTTKYAGTKLYIECNTNTFYMSQQLPFIEDSAGVWGYKGSDGINSYLNIKYNNGHDAIIRGNQYEWFFDNAKPQLGQKPIVKAIFFREGI